MSIFTRPSGVLVLGKELLVHRRHGQRVVVGLDEAHRATIAVVGLHARLEGRLAAVDGGEVHVGVAHHAITQHLGLAEHAAPVVVLLLHVHLALEGPDRVVEPLLKGLVFGVATQQRHGRVRVRVVERAHE